MQLRSDFEDIMDEQVGMIGAGYYDTQRVTIGMVSSLCGNKSGNKRKAEIQTYLDTVEYLMYDEVHHSQAVTWQMVARKTRNAAVRHGFSGTCFTSEVTLESGKRVSNRDIVLIGYTGKIINQMKTKTLVELGWLAKPTIYMIRNIVYSDGDKLQIADEYTRIIAKDQVRNEIAARITNKHYKEKEQTIVFVDRIQHGHDFVDTLVDSGIDANDVEYVTGEDNKYFRREAILDFKDGRLPVIVGTVLGEGLNFFTEAGINLAGGLSRKNTIQRLGRLLRKEPPESGDIDPSKPESAKYYDFLDIGHPWFQKHGQVRYQTYLDEGHTVVVIEFDEEGRPMTAVPNEPLQLKGENLKKVYKTFVKQYSDIGTFVWKKGEKGKVKNLFTLLAESFKIREEEKMGDALSLFEDYVFKHTKKWVLWDKASRDNYIGFLLNKENINVYKASKTTTKEQETGIAGTNDNDEWDF